MNERKPFGRRGEDPPCDEMYADDGVDPRKFFERRERERGDERKTLMLCHQVAETIRYLFAWECEDPVLGGLEVIEVVPAPNASRLRVEVAIGRDRDRVRTEAALARSMGRVRSEVAAAIHRKKVPELCFEVVVEEGDA
jgi:ribosome-binding factor A